MNKRHTKDLLYEHEARIGKAVSSPKRLELLEILAQGEKTVELMAAEASIGVKLASAHLKPLKEARLVETRREGRFIAYRLSGDDVSSLSVSHSGGRASDRTASCPRPVVHHPYVGLRGNASALESLGRIIIHRPLVCFMHE